MKVFKFGGASLKDAKSIANMTSIVKSHIDSPLMVVVSAMDKTTNALEKVLEAFLKKGDFLLEIQTIKDYHIEICNQLFSSPTLIVEKIQIILDELPGKLIVNKPFDELYDQVVSTGEILSSVIVEH
jgi:aspartate kinase